MTTGQGLDRRQAILRMQRERICHAYQVASDSGLEEPVVWLADQEDTFGHDLCLFALGIERLRLERLRAKVPPGGMVLHLFAWPLGDSLHIVRGMARDAAALLRQPRLGEEVNTVIVAGGGITTARVPMP
jgi:hypothetical protein